MAEEAGAAGPVIDDDESGSHVTLRCRMYEGKFPEIDELVTVQVKRIEEMGAYVTLLEYDDIEGMILLSELSRRRIRSINKLIRVGRQEVVMVLRVDPEKGYIDLSKRRVSLDDIALHEEKFNKSKAVHSIMRHVAETTGRPLEGLYHRFCWPLYKSHKHAFDAFRLSVSDPAAIFGQFDLEPEILDTLMKHIRRRLTPQPVKIRADFELTCFNYEGVDAIRRALLGSLACGSEDVPLKVKLVAPPLYVISTMSINKDKGIAAVEAALESIQKDISEAKGELVIKMTPRAVGEREDRMLAQLMEQVERQNKEIDGDDSEEESGDED
mmetsp:Transcript_28861/g.66682  ORF Transcript_28861/g.66682 Transcript_28861/m.66682 type:complete len:326 (+) Transcript_28861:60-1037(+)